MKTSSSSLAFVRVECLELLHHGGGLKVVGLSWDLYRVSQLGNAALRLAAPTSSGPQVCARVTH